MRLFKLIVNILIRFFDADYEEHQQEQESDHQRMEKFPDSF